MRLGRILVRLLRDIRPNYDDLTDPLSSDTKLRVQRCIQGTPRN